MRCMLGSFGSVVLELVEGSGEVVWHTDPTASFNIVPTDGEAAEEGARPVDRDSVELAEGMDKVLSGRFADILNAKVIDDEREGDG